MGNKGIWSYLRRIAASAAVLALCLSLLALPGLEPKSSRAESKTAAEVTIHVLPASVKLDGPRATRQLIVTARTAKGSEFDLTPEARYTVENPDIVAVSDSGFVEPLKNGTTAIVVEAKQQKVRVPVVVTNADRDQPVSYYREFIAALNVGGCNSGACHGTPSGKNGFKLSLRGYDPEDDYLQLTRDIFGRRTSRLSPDESLIWLKGTGQVPHGGGRRFGEDSVPGRILYTWLAQGMPKETATEKTIARVEVLPGDRVLRQPSNRQQLAVIAHFSDGSSADVTRLTVFSSSDGSIAEVNRTGLVEFAQSGEVAILCRYLDRMETIRLMYLEPRDGFVWPNPPENNYVDRHVFAKLKMLNIQPSELCSDTEFIRRVYMDVCGILPTPDEVRAFLADKRSDKRARLIDELLQRPEYADMWTLRWSDVLRSTRKKIELKGVFAFQSWLKSHIRRNTPWNVVVTQLLTGTGNTFDNPPANYYRIATDPTSLAETTAQLFLGVRMQCAKCHNHPFEKWTQDDYYSLAAFFARVKTRKPASAAKKKKDVPLEVYVVNQGEVVQPRRGKPIEPRFLGGTPAPVPPNTDRREVLARWLTSPQNMFFAKSTVNRIWYHLMGRGIVDPVDDFRDSNPSANDALLNALAKDFIESGYDVKHIIRVILNSRTYQLSAKTNDFNRDDEKYFSHALIKLYPAEPLFDAICTVTGVPEKFPGVPPGTRAVQLPDGEVNHPFLKTFGQPARELACECERETESNLAQALQLINGPAVNDRLRDPNNRIGKLLARKLPPEKMLEELYLTALSRTPTPDEARVSLAHVARAKDKRRAWEDVLWALINSKEFLFRH